MYILHFSDFHLFAADKESAHPRPDTVAAVEKVLADAASLTPQPDLVLISGDLADCGSAEDYALARQMLARFDAPVLVVPGNHDRRDAMRAVFSGTIPFTPEPFLNFDMVHKGIRVIGLDTIIPGKVEGELCAERLGWLADRLADEKAREETTSGVTFFMLHHPPFGLASPAWDWMTLTAGRDELRALLAGFPGHLRLLTGHVHRPLITSFAGHFAAIAGSPAFQYAPGLGWTSEPPLSAEPYVYWLHHITGFGEVITSPRMIDLG